MNKLTVIVPVHNVEKYLDRCLDSLSRIQMEEISILLMENASTDSSLQICQKWSSQDERFKVVHLDESGVSNARNKALELCDSEYLTFVDADDYIDPSTFHTNFTAFQNSEADIAITPFVKVRGETSFLCSTEFPQQIYKNDEILREIVQKRLAPGVNFFGAVWRAFYKSESIKGLHFNVQMQYHEDVVYLIEAMLKAKIVIILKQSHYYYRIDNGNSASANNSVNNSRQRFKIVEELQKIVASGINLDYAIAQRKLSIFALQFKEISLGKESVLSKFKAMWNVQKNIPREEIKFWEPAAFGFTVAIYAKLMKKRLFFIAYSFIALRYLIF